MIYYNVDKMDKDKVKKKTKTNLKANLKSEPKTKIITKMKSDEDRKEVSLPIWCMQVVPWGGILMRPELNLSWNGLEMIVT